MKIKKDRIRQLIREAINRILIENDTEKESSIKTQYGPDVLYVFDFDDCLVDSASRRGLAPAKATGKTYGKDSLKPGQEKYQQIKIQRDNGKMETFYYAWLRSSDYDALKRNNGGQRPLDIKSPDGSFMSVKKSITYELCDKEGNILIPEIEIESKPIQGTINAYKDAEKNGSKVIIITSRIAKSNPKTMNEYLSGLGIKTINPYFATDLTTTKGQRLLNILNSPGFENIKHVVIYEDNIEKLQDMKNTVEQLGLTSDTILVKGTEDISSRSHPNVCNGNVTYTYQKI